MPPTVIDIQEHRSAQAHSLNKDYFIRCKVCQTGCVESCLDCETCLAHCSENVKPLNRCQLAQGIASAYFLLKGARPQEFQFDVFDSDQAGWISRVLEYLQYRYNDLTLAGTPFAPRHPFVSLERLCEDCEGTGSVPANASSSSADRCCDECWGRGFLGGELDVHREKGQPR